MFEDLMWPNARSVNSFSGHGEFAFPRTSSVSKLASILPSSVCQDLKASEGERRPKYTQTLGDLTPRGCLVFVVPKYIALGTANGTSC
jgi:hypothetical protein